MAKPCKKCATYKYLGNHVSDGWDPLYNKRIERCKGYAATCQAMCTEMSLGIQMFSIFKMLHQAIFLNGSLVNMETWPMCNNKRITQFEKVEQCLIRTLLSAHSKTPNRMSLLGGWDHPIQVPFDVSKSTVLSESHKT